jgi:integrase
MDTVERERGTAAVPQQGRDHQWRGLDVPKFSEQNVLDIVAEAVVPKGQREVVIFDDAAPGFYVRVFASGKAAFGVKYRVAGAQRRLSLGPVIPKALAERRKQAGDVIAMARLGQDVQADKRAAAAKAKAEKEAAARRPVTLGDVAKAYLKARKGELRSRSYLEVERHIDRMWKPLHERPIAAVTRSDIVATLDDLERERGKVAADRARTSLSTLFGWAIDRSYIEAHPMLHIRARDTSRSRERVLSEAELAEVWKACEDDDYGRIVQLLILTGQRKSEIADLVWPEIDLDDKRQLELPPERTKNRRAHIVPLSDTAETILRDTPAAEGRDLVFGRWMTRKTAQERRAGGGGGFSGWSKGRADLDENILSARRKAEPKAKPMPDWVLHDLRRSFVTHMNERRFAPPHVIEAIVNHVSGHLAGVAGVYNKAQYLEERREALQRWADHVAALVKGRLGKVVAMRKRA